MSDFIHKDTCCFSGHRMLSDDEVLKIKERLNIDIQKLIDRGFKYFFCGGAIGFDTLAAEAVIQFRKTNPQIQLILLLPCRDQDKNWTLEQKGDYAKIKLQSDGFVFNEENYTTGCMLRRNRRLVENSTLCLCYYRSPYSGTSYTVNYAEQHQLEIINLAE